MTKEQQEQVYDRMERMERDSRAEVVELGQHTKKLSNEEWSEELMYGKM